MRVVADTNVYISALMFGGLPGYFLDLGLLRLFTLLASPAILDELQDKLCAKFDVQPEDANAVRAKLESVAELITPETTLDIVKDDPDDNRVLECASEGNADYLVSGDRHLLKLKSYRGIAIVSVRQFIDKLEATL
jgi:uncharacterized protein